MKNIRLLIYIIATLGLQVPAAKIKRQLMTTSVCAGKDGVLVAMPGNCSGFFFCMDGNAIASSCGNFYHFNSRLAICDHPDKAMCNDQATITEVATEEEATDVCSQAPEGFLFGKSLSCTLFYVCRQKQAVRRVCPPLKHFNVQAKVCQEVEKAQCVFAPPLQMATVTPARDSLNATNDSLRKPVHAKNSLQAHYAKNILSPASICSAYKTNVTVSHPSDCGKFIYCFSHHPQVMSCPKGLHFSKKKLRCEWASIAECKSNV